MEGLLSTGPTPSSFYCLNVYLHNYFNGVKVKCDIGTFIEGGGQKCCAVSWGRGGEEFGTTL